MVKLAVSCLKFRYAPLFPLLLNSDLNGSKESDLLLTFEPVSPSLLDECLLSGFKHVIPWHSFHLFSTTNIFTLRKVIWCIGLDQNNSRSQQHSGTANPAALRRSSGRQIRTFLVFPRSAQPIPGSRLCQRLSTALRYLCKTKLSL